jgi:hypothetical protein
MQRTDGPRPDSLAVTGTGTKRREARGVLVVVVVVVVAVPGAGTLRPRELLGAGVRPSHLSAPDMIPCLSSSFRPCPVTSCLAAAAYLHFLPTRGQKRRGAPSRQMGWRCMKQAGVDATKEMGSPKSRGLGEKEGLLRLSDLSLGSRKHRAERGGGSRRKRNHPHWNSLVPTCFLGGRDQKPSRMIGALQIIQYWSRSGVPGRLGREIKSDGPLVFLRGRSSASRDRQGTTNWGTWGPRTGQREGRFISRTSSGVRVAGSGYASAGWKRAVRLVVSAALSTTGVVISEGRLSTGGRCEDDGRRRTSRGCSGARF